jgi:hypothetical protein
MRTLFPAPKPTGDGKWLQVADVWKNARRQDRRWLEYGEWEIVFELWDEVEDFPTLLAVGAAQTKHRIRAARESGITAYWCWYGARKMRVEEALRKRAQRRAEKAGERMNSTSTRGWRTP